MSKDQTPSAAQLSAARSRSWHQAGNLVEIQQVRESSAADAEEPEIHEADADAAEIDGTGQVDLATAEHTDIGAAAMLTLEAARTYVERTGLLLFRPQPAMVSAPAGSFVEATLGEHRAEVTLAECALGRDLLTRLMAEGSAVALNLLGAPATTAESPDFLASAAVFPYVFTLRGDKTWKQLPSTTGPTKVSPLAVNTYALLAESEPRSASDLTAELGKGLTEAAVLRALGELWQQMRVLPVLQGNGKPTLWEPSAARWTKQLKAGANAGQPTALSALISLYLQQSIMATEEEIATFLSPLAARSRVRDVLHALVAARELQEVVIEGRNHLHVAGELPDLGAAGERSQAGKDSKPGLLEWEGRIRRMKDGKGERRLERSRPFASRPERREGAPRREDRGPKRFAARPDSRSERPSGPGGPSRRDDGPRRFDRPWEERAPRRAPQEGEGAGARPPRRDRPPFAGGGGSRFGEERPRRFERRDAGGGDRPAYKRARPAEGGVKPARSRSEGPGERRPFARPAGSPFTKGDDTRRAERTSGDEPRTRREFKTEARPARRSDESREGRPGGSERAGRAEGERRPAFRRFDAPRPGGKGSGGRSFGTHSERAGAEPRTADRPAKRPFAGAAARPPKRPFSGGEGRPSKRPFAGGEGRPARRDGERSNLRQESPFAKFSGGAKPWGKRPPKRKVKPLTDEERA